MPTQEQWGALSSLFGGMSAGLLQGLQSGQSGLSAIAQGVLAGSSGLQEGQDRRLRQQMLDLQRQGLQVDIDTAKAAQAKEQRQQGIQQRMSNLMMGTPEVAIRSNDPTGPTQDTFPAQPGADLGDPRAKASMAALLAQSGDPGAAIQLMQSLTPEQKAELEIETAGGKAGAVAEATLPYDIGKMEHKEGLSRETQRIGDVRQQGFAQTNIGLRGREARETAQFRESITPSSPEGKIDADWHKGFLTRDERNDLVRKAKQGAAQGLVTLVNPKTKDFVSLRKGDPNVDALIGKNGFVEVPSGVTSLEAGGIGKAPSGFRFTEGGDLEPIPGGPSDKPKQFTEGQAKSAGFANRMRASEQIATDLEQQGFDPANAGERAAGSVPLIGNYLLSPEFQQYRQAADDWIRAKLRKESGAVIAEEEMASEYRTYFPQPGDSQQVIEQKREARSRAEQNLVKESQGAYENMFRGGGEKSSGGNRVIEYDAQGNRVQ